MQNRASCSCHASCSTCKNRAKPCKLFHMQKPRKTVQAVRVMQKNVQAVPHAKTVQTVQAVRVMQKNVQAVPHAKTAQNRASCSCHAKTAQAVPHAKTIQKPCKMRRVRSANPLNIHSPRVPCYMCYMCYMALYSIYSTDFARTENIAHIVHIARSWGRVEVPRLGV